MLSERPRAGEGTSRALLPAALLVPWFVRRFLLFEPSRSIAKQKHFPSFPSAVLDVFTASVPKTGDQALYLI